MHLCMYLHVFMTSSRSITYMWLRTGNGMRVAESRRRQLKIDLKLTALPERGLRELPTYHTYRCIYLSVTHLCANMPSSFSAVCCMYYYPTASRLLGSRRAILQRVLRYFSRDAVAKGAVGGTGGPWGARGHAESASAANAFKAKPHSDVSEPVQMASRAALKMRLLTQKPTSMKSTRHTCPSEFCKWGRGGSVERMWFPKRFSESPKIKIAINENACIYLVWIFKKFARTHLEKFGKFARTKKYSLILNRKCHSYAEWGIKIECYWHPPFWIKTRVADSSLKTVS